MRCGEDGKDPRSNYRPLYLILSEGVVAHLWLQAQGWSSTTVREDSSWPLSAEFEIVVHGQDKEIYLLLTQKFLKFWRKTPASDSLNRLKLS